MRTARRTTALLTALVAAAAATITGVVIAAPASAHGSLSMPASRIWDCFHGDRTSPMCAAAWQANPQALYDWTEVNQPAANGNHQALIPDGQLCSAGRSKYAAFDTPSTQWKATTLRPDADGKYTLTWESTAPHATRYFRVYVTKAGFDVTKPLKWSDLELVHDTGFRPLEPTTTMRVDMPARQGRHVLYTVWQRSDSTEAFYSCSDVILDSTGTSTPTPTPTPASDVAYPLSTQGNRIVDTTGKTVIWQGVNWFGLETSNQAPHGLWTRDYRDMLKQIDDLGFNTIRLPFSLQAMRGTTTTGIDYAGGRNADLQGKTPLQVMDAVIDEAGRRGLMVILDNHSQANDGFMDGLWYGQAGFTEDDWVATWQMLATRYADDDHVVAFDLKNEPHGPATWGTGLATDWRRAAERAGNAVLARNPEVLIVVEGIEGPVAGGQQLSTHWWGGNLEGVRNHPVRLSLANRLVYSPHEYGPGVFAQPWFSSPDMAAALADRWQKGFGYIHEQGIAPIFIGEFGAKNVSPTTLEGRWITQFTSYLKSKGMSWTFWAWNPNSGDTGGVLQDDWRTVHEDKMALLRDLMGATTTPTPTPTPVPTPTPAPTPTPTPSMPGMTEGITASATVTSDWGTGFCTDVVVATTSTTEKHWRVDLPKGITVTDLWNGVRRTQPDGTVSVGGAEWNHMVKAGSPTSFGYCATRNAAAPTPTRTPTPTPTPTPSPVSSLTARFTVDSKWQSGACYTLEVANPTTKAVSTWTAGFTLAPGTAITQSWSGTVAKVGPVVAVKAPTWGATIPAGGKVRHFGMCISGVGDPTGVTAS